MELLYSELMEKSELPLWEIITGELFLTCFNHVQKVNNQSYTCTA